MDNIQRSHSLYVRSCCTECIQASLTQFHQASLNSHIRHLADRGDGEVSNLNNKSRESEVNT